MLDDKTMRARMQECLNRMDNIYEIADIRDAVKAGQMQWWQNGSGVCVTQVLTFPRKKILNVVMVFGRFADIVAIQDKVCEFGRANGCELFFTEGRPGWARVLPHYGWTNCPPRSHLKMDLRK